MEKDLLGPRFPLLAKICQITLASYRHPCWASGYLKNLSSTDSTDYRPQQGQLLSIFIEIFPCHSSTSITLWMTNHRKATSFCAFALKLGILMSQQQMSPWRSTVILEYVSYRKQVLNGWFSSLQQGFVGYETHNYLHWSAKPNCAWLSEPIW